MKMLLHKANERGGGEYGWLSTRYSFSFASWYEPSRMGFGALRVLNDDRIAPASGFGQHGHRDMEIITIVTKGAVTHTDSMGNSGVVPAGDVQVMSAGTGVLHAEENRSSTEELTLFQIWIEPHTHGIPPRYAQASFDLAAQPPGLKLLVSPDARSGSLLIYQDAFITHAVVAQAQPERYAVKEERNGVYVFVVEGEVMIGGRTLTDRDALGITGASEIEIQAVRPARLLLIEVPVRDE